MLEDVVLQVAMLLYQKHNPERSWLKHPNAAQRRVQGRYEAMAREVVELVRRSEKDE